MRCLDKCAIQRKSCQHSTPICHRAWPAIPSTIAQLVHHLQRSVSSLDWKRTAQRPAEQRTQVAPWYAPWSRPSADSKKIFADFIYPELEGLAGAKDWKSSNIKCVICSSCFCHFAKVGLAFVCVWSFCHLFDMCLPFFCRGFVIFLSFC